MPLTVAYITINGSVTPVTCSGHDNGSISVTVNGGTGPYQYSWSGNASGSNIAGLAAGTYSLTVTDIDNCKNELSFTVEKDTCFAIIVHDVITPNGDGINDTWVVEGLEDYPNNTVQVFDKWGSPIYEKHDYKNDWAGRSDKGGLIPDGTYFYLVKLNAENATGGKNVFTGSILIKR